MSFFEKLTKDITKEFKNLLADDKDKEKEKEKDKDKKKEKEGKEGKEGKDESHSHGMSITNFVGS